MKKNSKSTRLISCLCAFSLLATLLMPPLGLAKDDSMIAEKIDSNNLLYKDVQKGDYFAEALNFFTLTNLLPQTSDDLFHPRQPITRGEFFLWLHSFLYASEAHAIWDREKAAQALVDLGIITGYEDSSLRLDSTISRAEAAVILQRVLKLESSAVVLNKFTDVEQGLWYSEAIGALANYQFIQGKGDGYFAPHDLITKAEAITLLYRTLFQSKQIEDIRDGQLIINGQTFAYHPVLAGLFAESNRSALLNARVEFTMKDGAIETITSLYLNNKNEDSLSLDGNGAIIQGELFVSGPTVSISNLGIIGGLFVSSEVTDSFTSDALIVEGFTFFLPSFSNNSSSQASLSVYAHDTSFGGLILSRNIQLQSFQKDIELVSSKPLAQKKLNTMKIASIQANETSPDIEKLLRDLDGRQDLLREDVLEALLRQKEENDQEIEEILRDLSKEENLDQHRQNMMDILHNLTKIESGGKITEEQIEEIIKNINNTIAPPGYQYELDRNPLVHNRNAERDSREELREKMKSDIEQKRREIEQKQREIEEKQRETEERIRKELEQKQSEREEKQSEELHETNHDGEKSENEAIEEEYSETEQQDNTNKDINYEFIIIGTPDDGKQDPSQLEIELEESEEPIIVISDTQLSTTDEGELSSVYLVGVAHFTLESNIEHLVIEQQDEAETTVEGSGQIGQVELNSSGQVSIAVQGEIERLVINNPETSIHLDENTIIENIELAEGIELEDVIQNIEDIGNNIRNINGQPYSPAEKGAPSSSEGSSDGGGGSKPPSYSGEPQTVTATFTVTDSVYKAIASGTIDGINYTLEIEPNINESVRDTITFTIKRILLEQADTVAAVEITGLGDRVVRSTISIPAKISAHKATLYAYFGERWKYRGGQLNDDGDAISSTPSMLDSTYSLAVAEEVPTPTNIQASQITADSITLTWDEVPEATGYQLYRYHESTGLIAIKVVETTSFTDTGLTSGTKYEYLIIALKNNFESSTNVERFKVITK